MFFYSFMYSFAVISFEINPKTKSQTILQHDVIIVYVVLHRIGTPEYNS